MPHLLVIYGTSEGQTRKIAEVVATLASDAGHRVRVGTVDEAAELLRPRPDAVFVAASVHVGQHPPAVERLIVENLALLNALPTAFLSVSLSAADEATQAEAQRYVADFLQKTGWRPAVHGTVAGALRYSQYGFLKKLLMKWMAGRGGLPTDSSRDHEFTDWNQVRRFTASFLTRVAAPVRLAGSPA